MGALRTTSTSSPPGRKRGASYGSSPSAGRSVATEGRVRGHARTAGTSCGSRASRRESATASAGVAPRGPARQDDGATTPARPGQRHRHVPPVRRHGGIARAPRQVLHRVARDQAGVRAQRRRACRASPVKLHREQAVQLLRGAAVHAGERLVKGAPLPRGHPPPQLRQAFLPAAHRQPLQERGAPPGTPSPRPRVSRRWRRLAAGRTEAAVLPSAHCRAHGRAHHAVGPAVAREPALRVGRVPLRRAQRGRRLRQGARGLAVHRGQQPVEGVARGPGKVGNCWAELVHGELLRRAARVAEGRARLGRRGVEQDVRRAQETRTPSLFASPAGGTTTVTRRSGTLPTRACRNGRTLATSCVHASISRKVHVEVLEDGARATTLRCMACASAGRAKTTAASAAASQKRRIMGIGTTGISCSGAADTLLPARKFVGFCATCAVVRGRSDSIRRFRTPARSHPSDGRGHLCPSARGCPVRTARGSTRPSQVIRRAGAQSVPEIPPPIRGRPARAGFYGSRSGGSVPGSACAPCCRYPACGKRGCRPLAGSGGSAKDLRPRARLGRSATGRRGASIPHRQRWKSRQSG